MRAEIKVTLKSPTSDPETFDRKISQVIRMIHNIGLMTPDIEVKAIAEHKQILTEEK